jgi:hypothetical protein
VLRAAREHGVEGIVSKRRGSAYHSDRVKSWVKAVCTVRDSFAVIGAARCCALAFPCGKLADGPLHRNPLISRSSPHAATTRPRLGVAERAFLAI